MYIKGQGKVSEGRNDPNQEQESLDIKLNYTIVFLFVLFTTTIRLSRPLKPSK